MIDPIMKQYATPRQIEYIDAVNKCGTQPKAAKYLNINRRSLERGLAAVHKKAALHGLAPEHDMTRTVPEPFIVKVFLATITETENCPDSGLKQH